MHVLCTHFKRAVKPKTQQILTVTFLRSPWVPQAVIAEILDVQGFASLCKDLLLLFPFSLLLASPLLNLQKVKIVKTVSMCDRLLRVPLKPKCEPHRTLCRWLLKPDPMFVRAIFFLVSSSTFLWTSASSFLIRSACKTNFKTSRFHNKWKNHFSWFMSLFFNLDTLYICVQKA